MHEEELIAILKSHAGVNEDLSYWTEAQQIRALMNISMPDGLDEHYYHLQDEFLQGQKAKKTIVEAESLSFERNISIWRGDITCLKSDAIVNACNEKMLGCFVPLHGCVDNAIHSAAGLQVRRDLEKMMEEQGHDEPNGQVKVTKGYNLPSSYIFHTVGPIVQGRVSRQNEEDLRSCYLSCLKKADEMGLKTIAFCSLSTGIYGYPIEAASSLAIETVERYLTETKPSLRVVFCVYSEKDEDVYRRNWELWKKKADVN